MPRNRSRDMIQAVTSYDNATPGSGNVINQCALTYNTFGQLVEEQQEHSGVVTGSSVNVQYGYDSGASNSNEIRPATLTYPNGRIITYNHGTGGGMDDRLNRITAIQDSGTNLAQYTYLGLSTVIRIDYTQPQVRLELWGGTSGVYSGLDLFNRVIDQRWQFYGTPTADVDRYQYGYDQDSNRIWKANLLTTGLDELYVYDALNRLVTMQRGSLNSAKTAIGGALVVTQLGRWVVSGNTGTHSVKLVDAATGTDLSGGSVSVNTNGATAGQYLYAPLANPLPLQPGHSYYLMSQETLGGDQWYDQNTTLTVTSDLTVYNAEWYDGNYHAGNAGSIGYVPPNFTYGPVQPAVTGQTLGTLRNDFTGWVGFRFTPTSGTPVREMDWTLDPTGNWNTYLTKTSGTVDLNQTRTNNKVNEITAVGGTPTWVTPAYDAAGNTITFPQPASPTSSYAAVFDAWNRMVQVSSGGTVVAQYKYDGSNRRIVKLTYTSGVLSETRRFYSTASWQSIEERVGTSTAMERQYVWGIRYIDELICRDRTTERLYAAQDANLNVTAICNTSGTVAERYRYDPYGNVTIMSAAWAVIGSSAYAWLVGHQGLMQDPETLLIYNRRRLLHPLLGRFVTGDPFGYFDGTNLYTYVRSNPPNLRDPRGEQVAQLWGLIWPCVEKFLVKWLNQQMDAQSACGALGNILSGVAGPDDPTTVDLCKGYTFPYPYNHYHDPSETFSKEVQHCVRDAVKGKLIERLLEPIEDPLEKKFLEKVLDKITDPEEEKLSVEMNVTAKCVKKQVAVTLEYDLIAKVGDESGNINHTDTYGPYVCSKITQWLTAGNFDKQCCDC